MFGFGSGVPDYASDFSGGDPNSGWLSGLGKMISEKPEQFSIMADMIGSRLDPGNTFAGVGQTFGKSSLANKALAEEKKEKQDWRSMIAKILSGEEKLTAPGEPGLSGATIKPSKDGGASEISLSLTEPTDEGRTKKKLNSLNMSELMQSPF